MTSEEFSTLLELALPCLVLAFAFRLIYQMIMNRR